MQERDQYWQVTREQLKAVQNRGDLATVLGLLGFGALLWMYYEPDVGFTQLAMAGIAVALVVICAPAWLVARRKRSISVARGLVCPHCGHAPHDTEISEVVETRRCQNCNQPLD
jgi:hypothetical protein